MKKIIILLTTITLLIACTDETKVQSITLNPTEKTLNIGESFQIEMLIDPISAIIYNPTSWKSSNPNVAQVDDNGVVTAIYAGECLITGKTKKHEAYCKITVVAPQYNITFTNAILFDEGIKLGNTQRNLILRLYDDNLSIDSTGSTLGNGLFLNINLYAPSDSKQLPVGIYNTSDTINDFTILPGALRQEGNAYYATGSYLGQYTDNGLSALFLASGVIEVSQNDNYSITCSFLGTQAECVNATFNGEIPIYDTSAENQTTTFKYNNVTTEQVDISNEPTLNHVKINFLGNDSTISFIARIPKSISYLPQGKYYLSTALQAYTLCPQHSFIIAQNDTTIINFAILNVESEKYSATFTDINNINYSLQIQKKHKNVSKQKLNSFVY